MLTHSYSISPTNSYQGLLEYRATVTCTSGSHPSKQLTAHWQVIRALMGNDTEKKSLWLWISFFLGAPLLYHRYNFRISPSHDRLWHESINTRLIITSWLDSNFRAIVLHYCIDPEIMADSLTDSFMALWKLCNGLTQKF